MGKIKIQYLTTLGGNQRDFGKIRFFVGAVATVLQQYGATVAPGEREMDY